MDTNNQMQMKHGGTCSCMGCQMNEFRAHHMGYRMARKVFLILVILIAFWFGTRYGEIKAFEYQARSGGRFMMQERSVPQNMMFTGSAGSVLPQ